MLYIPVRLGELEMKAVVDTAAEVSIISDKVYSILKPQPPTVENIILQTADRNLKMKAMVVGRIPISLGSVQFEERLHVAPIGDDMLLGLDLITMYGMDISVRDSKLTIGLHEIPLHFGTKPQNATPHHVKRVTVYSAAVIPPNCVKRVNCNVEGDMESTFMFQPTHPSPIWSPRIVFDRGKDLSTYVVNLTDSYHRLPAGLPFGTAEEVTLVEPNIVDGQNFEETDISVKQTSVMDSPSIVPSHLTDLRDRSSESLSARQIFYLDNLLSEYQNVFARDDFDLGNFRAVTHKIDTGTANPIKQKMRRTPINFAQEEKAHLDKMLKAGVIKPSISEWASPPVLIRKRDGSVRWCIDYRALNSVTRKDVYPLPRIEECLDTLAGNISFSKLDASDAYWQIHVDQPDQEKTAFITRYGLYEFERMGFGLCNAPATFSRAMNLILCGLTWEIALAFLDDILVLGKSFEEHLKNLWIVLNRFQQFELKLKPKKCALLQTKVEFLGREVDNTGIHLRAEHVQAVQSWPVPKNTREVERFLGLVNYHRVFLKNYAKVAAPLYALTGKQPFKWEEAHQCAFESIKHMLITAPVLTLPDSTDGFVLDTDASDIALGAELLQIQNGEEKVISYGSCVLAKEQRRYCVTRKELLAVVLFTRFYRHYLLGKPFLVRTDHSSLRWLLNFKRPQPGQIARWIEELSQYDFHIEHRKGNKHVNADALSRIPQPPSSCSCYQLGSKLKDLPCGGCHHCERVHKRWAYFVEEVDDAVPLSKRSPVCKVSMTVPGTSDSPPSISPQVEEIGELREVTILRCSIPTVNAISLSDISDENFREAQEKETYFGPIRAWLESQTVPSQAEIMLWGAEQKFLWINRDLLILKDGLLYWKKDEQLFVVVPRALREQIMQVNHDLPSSAHPGCDRTFAKLTRVGNDK
ncbi:uncharacterized protein LOC135153446 [Lytechinus pictus]|uniref:uncharacterized protein LOC135153446 n=1 Tax=Lytechinus pictus TaxID=7653 RepID=UPI0030BA2393